MKIAQLTPGSGKNFYCENCQRDITIVKALRERGYDILLMPLYLPLQTVSSENPANSPVFFGGINVYLQQKLSFFRKSPRWLDSIFDHPKLLELISRRSSMVNAKELGETTLSILSGEDGRQVKELNRLTNWLVRKENKPDILCLSNLLLCGLAGQIKSRLDIPIVCFLQDEDEFVDQLPEYYREKSWQIIRQRSEDIDLFIPVSDYYRSYMLQRLEQREEKFRTVRIGIDVSNYSPRTELPEEPCVGYLSRLCPGKGLDILVEAFIKLKSRGDFGAFRLKIAGGLSGEDHIFIKSIRQKIASANLADDVDFLPYIEGSEKHDFLRSLWCICVPEKRPASYGLYVLESFALGVPAVEPDEGVFPELIDSENTGGIVYKPNNAEKLSEALAGLLSNSDKLVKLGNNARKEAEKKFSAEISADKLAAIYKDFSKQK
jgi:glycosyltransferase involved in cell wall biosynthesis